MISNSFTSTTATEKDLLDLIKLLEAGLIITNRFGQVLLWNPWMERVTGISATQALNQKLHQIFATSPAQALLDTIEQACDDRLSRRLSHQLHPRLLPLEQANSAEALHHSILVRPLLFSGQNACLLQINDVSSTVRREAHLREAEALLRFEKEVLSLVANNQKIETVWLALCTGMQTLAPGAEAGVLLWQEDQQALVSPIRLAHQTLPSRATKDTSSAEGCAFLTAKVQQVESQAAHEPAHYWCYPLIASDGLPFGVLQLAWPSATQKPSARLSLLERSAQLAIIAFQNHLQLLKVQHLAEHDALTGLANRSLLNKKLEALCEPSQQKTQRFALLFIDLDGFKLINDEHGHDAGDAFLVEIAQRLKAALGKEDLVTRLGGDELVVLSKEAQQLDTAFQLADRLNRCIEEPFTWKGKRLNAGASIGISLFPEQGQSPDELLTQADNAMYLAKSRGKGQAASCDLP